MTYRLTYILLILSTALMTAGCKKRSIDTGDQYRCHERQPNDSASLVQRIAGHTWKYTQRACYWMGETTAAEKEMTVTFNKGGNYFVRENAATFDGRWHLIPSTDNAGKWKVETDSSFAELGGYILLCDDRLQFSLAYRDVCDHLFLKAD